MPCRYVIDKQRRLVNTIASGHLTFAEAKAHQDQLASDRDFDPGFNQLIDTTEVTVADLSARQLRAIVSRQFFSSESRRAVLATQPVIYGMGRMAQAYHEIVRGKAEMQIFYDRSAAMRWLGLEDDTSPSSSET